MRWRIKWCWIKAQIFAQRASSGAAGVKVLTGWGSRWKESVSESWPKQIPRSCNLANKVWIDLCIRVSVCCQHYFSECCGCAMYISIQTIICCPVSRFLLAASGWPGGVATVRHLPHRHPQLVSRLRVGNRQVLIAVFEYCSQLFESVATSDFMLSWKLASFHHCL
jgi:hypothetical protein